MPIRRALWLRLRALAARGRVERELDDELAFHVERETQRHIAAGLTAEDARRRARARFGSMTVAADQCRDARGTAGLDDVARDIQYAARTFRRAPLVSFTIIATVALGLGLVTAVFTIYNLFFLRLDAVHRPDELFAIVMTRQTDGDRRDVTLTPRDFGAVRRETSVFTDAVAVSQYAGAVDGRLARSAFVSGNFFQLLGVRAAIGRSLVPQDDMPDAGRVIVLSDVGWSKLFRRDHAVLGRRAAINGASYEIVGVMPDGFRGLGVTPPDYWAPMSVAWEFGNDAGGTEDVAIEVVGRLKPATSPDAATAALAAWASRRPELTKGSSGRIDVRLMPRRGTLPADPELQILFVPLFFAFGLVLLIGCANVANLLLARGVSRQREIGVRLSLGASRRRVLRQLLTENLLLSLTAAVAAFFVSRVFLAAGGAVVMRTIPPEFAAAVGLLNLAAPAADWRIWTFLAAGAVASTAFFALAPALQATRLDVVRTMRGEVTRDARPRRARQTLVAIQVGASALLLICAAVFLRGAVAAATSDPGVRTSDTLQVNIDGERERPAVLQELRTHPVVAVVAAESRPERGVVDASGPAARVPANQVAVSSDYFNVLGLAIVHGRAFTPAERTAEAGVAIVSQRLARQLWPRGGGVGETVRFEVPRSQTPAPTLAVIGIVGDAGYAAAPSVYVPTALESPGTTLTLRVRSDPESARLALLERLTGLDPAFGIMTLRTATRARAYALQIAFGVAVVLGALALALTVSGLFSVLSYVVEQRAKDIGVCMALGASTRDVARLVLSESLRPVSIGLAAGVGLAVATAIVLLATPVASELEGSVNLTDPAPYAASVLIIAVACLLAVSAPTLRAARLDPIATLRKD